MTEVSITNTVTEFNDISPAVANVVTERNTTLREQLWLHPSLVWLRSKENKAAELTITAVDEVLDKPTHPLGIGVALPVASVAAMGLTQALDRIRIVVKEAPPRAIDAMVNMDFSKPSTLAATVIVAVAFAVWNFTAGEVLSRTIEQFPRTTEKFVEMFPRVVRAAEYAIPSELVHFNEERANSETKIDKGGVGKRLKRGLKRGWSAFSFGSTIHMGVASINGIPVNERTKINAEVSRDGAIFSMAPVTAAIAEVVRQSIMSGDADRAATVLSWAQDKSNWNWVAAGVMGATVGLNALSRRKAGKELETEENDQSLENPELA